MASADESPDTNPRVQVPRFFLDSNVMFPGHPVFAPGLLIRDVPRGLGVDFLGGPRRFILRGSRTGEVFLFLRENLDGSRTVPDLLGLLPPSVEPALLLDTLKLLHQQGALVDGKASEETATAPRSGPNGYSEAAYFARNLTVTRSASSANEIARRAGASRLVTVAGGLVGRLTVEMLQRGGLLGSDVVWVDAPGQLDEEGDVPVTEIAALSERLSGLLPHADLLVVAVKGATTLLETSMNDVCLESRTPLLYANDAGDGVEICLVDPFRSSCLICKRMREDLVSDFALEDYLFADDETEGVDLIRVLPAGESFTSALLAAAQVAAEAFRFATGIAPLTLTNGLMHLDPLSGVTRTSRILRVPRCPACSNTSVFGQQRASTL